MATPVADEARILYLEPDDEIPSVVRRLSEADGDRVILVAPGRTKITSSAIGLRLLAREASEAGRSLRLVADAASRALAAEAGIEGFASVVEAQAGESRSLEPSAPAHAPIHIVRGEPTPPHVSLASLTASLPAGIRTDDTQAIPIPVPPAAAPRRAAARRQAMGGGFATPHTGTLVAGAVAILLLAGIVAALLPGATVELTRSVTPVGPVSYQVTLPSDVESGSLDSTQSGQASGTYDDSKPAHGTATFANYNSQKVTVPKGTQISAGDQVYTTDAAIVVRGAKGIDNASTADVAITAAKPGPNGNVDTGAIDTVDDGQLRSDLCDEFLFCTRRLVANRAPVTGGTTKTGKQITQADVDAVVAKIRDDLGQQLAARLSASGAGRIFAPPEQSQDPVVTIPKDLVGTKDKASFELSGSLQFERRYVTDDQVARAASDSLSRDQSALGGGRELVGGSLSVQASDLKASGDQIAATLAVSGSAARQIDAESLKGLILGRSPEDAAQALRPYGIARVDLWPGWVDSVPRLGFRVDIQLVAPSVNPSSSASVTTTP